MIQTICRVGDALGVVISDTVFAKLRLGEGDRVRLVELPQGILISPVDSPFLTQIVACEEGMAKYRNALRELAK